MRFDQVKILAGDLGALAPFYGEALDCVTVVPIQTTDHVAARGVGVPDAEVTLTVLRLPGRGDHGPVLELYEVDGQVPADWSYRPGQSQLAFEVEDLETSIGKVMASGGSSLGDVVEWQAPSGAVARFVYMRDPEGNVIDLWSRVE